MVYLWKLQTTTPAIIFYSANFFYANSFIFGTNCVRIPNTHSVTDIKSDTKCLRSFSRESAW